MTMDTGLPIIVMNDWKNNLSTSGINNVDGLILIRLEIESKIQIDDRKSGADQILFHPSIDWCEFHKNQFQDQLV